MPMAVLLETSQIEAAKRLHGRLQQWKLTDDALALLSGQFPGFTPREALIKATVINALYGTNVKAIVPVARHVSSVLVKPDSLSRGPELVEILASIPQEAGKKYPLFRSFASKFAHFFIDTERFPIMDSYSVRMVKLHLGKANYVNDEDHPYLAFVVNYEDLKANIGHKGSNRDLDRYLWLSGEFIAWKKDHDSAINVELRSVFEKPDAETAAELEALIPSILSKSFAGAEP
jgi:hypothetical protein